MFRIPYVSITKLSFKVPFLPTSTEQLKDVLFYGTAILIKTYAIIIDLIPFEFYVGIGM